MEAPKTKKTKKTKAELRKSPRDQPAIPAKPKKPNAWTQFVKENISKMKGDTPQIRMKLCAEVYKCNKVKEQKA